MFKEDLGFWIWQSSKVEYETIRRWVAELHPNMSAFRYVDDIGEHGGFTWLDGTHCCALCLDDPPVWFVVRTWREATGK